MEVIIIRHGQSESNARLTVDLDSNLTDLGRKQADATAEYLLCSPILTDLSNVVLYTSPFRRTLQTCKPLAGRSKLRARLYPDVCEYFAHTNEAYAAFAGLGRHALEAEYPFADIAHVTERGECWWPQTLEDLGAIYARAERVRDELYRLYAGSSKQIVIFSHAEPIGRLIEAMLRTGPATGWPPWTENCGICRLTVDDPSQPADLFVMNDTSHLRQRGLASPSNL